MKKMMFFVLWLSMTLIATSQNLTVEGTAPNLYITHTVAPKENFYSVGRLYNQLPRSIASFNNLVMEKGLTIGQHIKIPLNSQNFDATGSAANGESLIPLTHIVAKSETLTKIGNDFNVNTASIKQWNNLSSDNITPGSPLVVGHLKMTSDAASPNTPAVAVNTPQPAPKKEEVANTPAFTPEVTATKESTTPQQETAQPAATESAVKEIAVSAPAPAKETAKPTRERKAEQDVSRGYQATSTSSLGSVEGAFAGFFTTDVAQKNVTTKNGEAATFKSTSGWQDKKYYVLMNDVEPGTILKIASSENKVVYAKVLGSMPEMKENNGLLLRISNAAASYLGIIDPKFPVQISYYQ